MARVLVVDDEKSIRLTLGQFLRQEGHEVELAEDADTAMALCRSNDFDLVVTDIILPRISGVELLRWIHEAAPDIPVIMMTGEPTVETAVEAVRAGAHEYLCKPITKSAVVSAAAKAARWKALSDEKKRLEAENLQYQEGLERLVEERTEALQGSLQALSESNRQLGETNQRLNEAIDELRRTQQQVLQQERLNALGQLAGGIAHDFNNMLIPIMTYSSLISDSLPEGHPLRERAKALLAAAERSAGLPRQLLAFSRKQVQELRVLDLNSIVKEMRKMLGRLIREDIDLVVETDPNPTLVLADAGQIEQVVMNLVLNARDAMPEAGRLAVCTGHVHLDTGLPVIGAEIPPGAYVRVSVSDTGCGMDAETLGRIFEPFFTTKEPGKGTGLGLASVYGIVQQTHGYVRVQSELGKGSIFEVLLPPAKADAPGEVRRADPSSGPTHGNRGKILLVDDDPNVREAVEEMLTEAGYTVVVAANGTDAIEQARRHQGRLDLLITDVVMPGLNGRETAERIAAIQPGIKVLFMSGHTEDVVMKRGVLEGGMILLRKPFSPRVLRERVQQLLA